MRIGDKYKVIKKIVTNGNDYFEKDEIVLYNGIHGISFKIKEFTSLDKQSFFAVAESQLSKFLEKI